MSARKRALLRLVLRAAVGLEAPPSEEAPDLWSSDLGDQALHQAEGNRQWEMARFKAAHVDGPIYEVAIRAAKAAGMSIPGLLRELRRAPKGQAVGQALKAMFSCSRCGRRIPIERMRTVWTVYCLRCA